MFRMAPPCTTLNHLIFKCPKIIKKGLNRSPCQSISAPAKTGVALQSRSGWIFGVALRVALRLENRSCAPTSAPTPWSARSGSRSDQNENYEHTPFHKIWLKCVQLQRSSKSCTNLYHHILMFLPRKFIAIAVNQFSRYHCNNFWRIVQTWSIS